MTHSQIWMSTEEIIRKVPCSCVDGRIQGPRFSAAGGNLGLVVHRLAVENTCSDSHTAYPSNTLAPAWRCPIHEFQ